MSQYIKFEGVIKNPLGRPVLTASSEPAFLILDARRYAGELDDGVIYDEVQAIGSMRDSDLVMRKSESPEGSRGFLFSIKDGVPSFYFNDKQSLHASFPIKNKPITVVCVYRVAEESWPSNSQLSRIYSLGRTPSSALKFLPLSNNLLVWATAENGTSYKYDQPHLGWAVGVHKFDGKNSRVVTRHGELLKVELVDTESGPSVASLFGNAEGPTSTKGGIRYFAAYDRDMLDSELMSLFYDAKNSFNIP